MKLRASRFLLKILGVAVVLLISTLPGEDGETPALVEKSAQEGLDLAERQLATGDISRALNTMEEVLYLLHSVKQPKADLMERAQKRRDDIFELWKGSSRAAATPSSLAVPDAAPAPTGKKPVRPSASIPPAPASTASRPEAVRRERPAAAAPAPEVPGSGPEGGSHVSQEALPVKRRGSVSGYRVPLRFEGEAEISGNAESAFLQPVAPPAAPAPSPAPRRPKRLTKDGALALRLRALEEHEQPEQPAEPLRQRRDSGTPSGSWRQRSTGEAEVAEPVPSGPPLPRRSEAAFTPVPLGTAYEIGPRQFPLLISGNVLERELARREGELGSAELARWRAGSLATSASAAGVPAPRPPAPLLSWREMSAARMLAPEGPPRRAPEVLMPTPLRISLVLDATLDRDGRTLKAYLPRKLSHPAPHSRPLKQALEPAAPMAPPAQGPEALLQGLLDYYGDFRKRDRLAAEGKELVLMEKLMLARSTEPGLLPPSSSAFLDSGNAARHFSAELAGLDAYLNNTDPAETLYVKERFRDLVARAELPRDRFRNHFTGSLREALMFDSNVAQLPDNNNAPSGKEGSSAASNLGLRWARREEPHGKVVWDLDVHSLDYREREFKSRESQGLGLKLSDTLTREETSRFTSFTPSLDFRADWIGTSSGSKTLGFTTLTPRFEVMSRPHKAGRFADLYVVMAAAALSLRDYQGGQELDLAGNNKDTTVPQASVFFIALRKWRGLPTRLTAALNSSRNYSRSPELDYFQNRLDLMWSVEAARTEITPGLAVSTRNQANYLGKHRSDFALEYALSAGWKFRKDSVNLKVGLRRGEQDSNLGDFDFTSNQIFAELSTSF